MVEKFKKKLGKTQKNKSKKLEQKLGKNERNKSKKGEIMKNNVVVNTKNELFPVAEDLYGLFFEDINRAGDGGLYPEMIRNRSFEDALTPDGCTVDEDKMIYLNKADWPGAFNHGEGMDEWAAAVPYTEIPGWYAEAAQIQTIDTDTLNKNRRCAMKVNFAAGGKIYNIGYAGVYVKNGDEYKCYAFIKTDKVVGIKASLESNEGRVYAEAVKRTTGENNWERLDFDLKADADDFDGRIAFSVDEECEILFGFTSLMPEKTFKGHGLRIDLCEMLKNLHPKFLRFPGGCIVEGLTYETAMRFTHTIGEPWERPSHNLMWHYRTTNGLGFHEYMQLCEDLEIEAMYVCNCGISCQARRGETFDKEGTEEMLQEALKAMEYALGDETTTYGAIRAKMGHPQPFELKYVEIGNENWGKDYDERYELFYKTLKEKYPDVIYISNGHTERVGLPTEFADEHYYNTPEFFMENYDRFDTYDRKGPKIFLGEYAVNGGNTIASMECALAEAVFLSGVERNQDVVTLSAYAPLFQNSDYVTWKPNLIVFDNHQVYGIPSYHAIALMGKYRGENVVETELKVQEIPPAYKGIPGISCDKEGLEFKNAKVNGKSVDISKIIYGDCVKNEAAGTYTMKKGGNLHPFTGKSDVWNEAFGKFIRGDRDERNNMWLVFGDEDLEEYVFEIDAKFERENNVTFTSWNFHPETDAGCVEPKDYDWNFGSVRNQIWRIEDGKGTTERRRFFEHEKPEPKKEDLGIDYSDFNTYKIVTNHYGYECFINGKSVQKKEHALHPEIYAVASTDSENVYIKIINAALEPKNITVSLDSEIKPDMQVETLVAAPDAVNSFENKENVSTSIKTLTNGAREFDFVAEPYSINVIKAKKM